MMETGGWCQRSGGWGNECGSGTGGGLVMEVFMSEERDSELDQFWDREPVYDHKTYVL